MSIVLNENKFLYQLGKKSPKKKAKAVYWRVAVFDKKLGRFIVKKCSLLKEEAEFQQFLFMSEGLKAKIAPCS